MVTEGVVPPGFERAGRLSVRERIDLLLDSGTFVEDGRLARADAGDLPADGVVTGRGLVEARPVMVIANDITVLAGSWGAGTVEKMVRAAERALLEELPIFWFIDSAGARMAEQSALFPGRRGAGRVFDLQVALSGKVPQICCVFSAHAGGAGYSARRWTGPGVPSFCDFVVMVGVEVPGIGDNLAADDCEAVALARRFHSYLPSRWSDLPPEVEAVDPTRRLAADLVPEDHATPFDVHDLLAGVVDADSFLELKPTVAPELVTGIGRLGGRPVGVVANNPAVEDGVLFLASADKAARFISMCDAYNVPLLFLADAPGFMIGTAAADEGIVRLGARMIAAVAEASVPRITVIVRRAHGTGLFAMGGPGFDPDAVLALPGASVAIADPETVVQALHSTELEGLDGASREVRRRELSDAFAQENGAIALASRLDVDAVVDPGDLRRELAARFALLAGKRRARPTKHHAVPPN